MSEIIHSFSLDLFTQIIMKARYTRAMCMVIFNIQIKNYITRNNHLINENTKIKRNAYATYILMAHSLLL